MWLSGGATSPAGLTGWYVGVRRETGEGWVVQAVAKGRADHLKLLGRGFLLVSPILPYPGGRTRARSRAKPARPYIWRFTSFSPAQRAPDLSFDRTVAPRQGQTCEDGVPVPAQAGGEATQRGDPARAGAGHPLFQAARLSAPDHPEAERPRLPVGELLSQVSCPFNVGTELLQATEEPAFFFRPLFRAAQQLGDRTVSASG